MEKGLEIDFDTADRVTLLLMKNNRKYLKEELEYHKNGMRMHPEDVIRNQEVIATLELLIPYYGGTND
jgi:hypothetical protein